MSRLTFDAADVRRVAAHALRTGTQNVLLVHDQGVYLMSGGEPRDIVEGTTSFCAFAKGCDPRSDDEWYDTARSLVGGDDFGEELPFATAMLHEADKGAKTVTLVFKAESIAMLQQAS